MNYMDEFELAFARIAREGDHVRVKDRPNYGLCRITDRGQTHAVLIDETGIVRSPLLTSLRSAAIGHTTVTPPEKEQETPTETKPRTGT